MTHAQSILVFLTIELPKHIQDPLILKISDKLKGLSYTGLFCILKVTYTVPAFNADRKPLLFELQIPFGESINVGKIVDIIKKEIEKIIPHEEKEPENSSDMKTYIIDVFDKKGDELGKLELRSSNDTIPKMIANIIKSKYEIGYYTV